MISNKRLRQMAVETAELSHDGKWAKLDDALIKIKELEDKVKEANTKISELEKKNK